ncbi:hypothetical protein EJ05DRAFT_513738 [Pseudovirgaria hyperparasitica]|uniref:CID domain-containing protein n=1 Tax=Pseudovirgaria hyperparasitica TaxID=470096 RepID=A0A6A6VZR3_9PEZI|nr:uncharacterized protein EJ05DRAFT_513738 [Pseudovirgaria hyperparasitica]KAF2754817.1 hypothetical protein EJ05DRAFT_513738 [Pseudovirgaria hyperparasitica]
MADLQIKEATLRGSLGRSFPAQHDRAAVDPVPNGKETELKTLINNVLEKCSSANITKCKTYVIIYVVPSEERIQKLGAYLEALSKSLQSRPQNLADRRKWIADYSVGLRRLFMLYLISDILYHVQKLKGKEDSTNAIKRLVLNIDETLIRILQLAADLDVSKTADRQLHAKLKEVINLWKERAVFTEAFIDDLYRIIEGGGKHVSLSTTGNCDRLSYAIASREGPYDLPALYGEAKGRWYDQPVGVMMYNLSLEPGRSIRKSKMKPMPMTKGRASAALVSAVDDFIADLKEDRNAAVNEGRMHNIDRLGQIIVKDKKSGNLTFGDTYYGFSRDFLETLNAIKAYKKQKPSRSSDLTGSLSLDEVVKKRGGSSGEGNGAQPHWKKLQFWSAQRPTRSTTPSRSRSQTPRRSQDRYARSRSPRDRYCHYNRRSSSRDRRRDSREHVSRNNQHRPDRRSSHEQRSSPTNTPRRHPQSQWQQSPSSFAPGQYGQHMQFPPPPPNLPVGAPWPPLPPPPPPMGGFVPPGHAQFHAQGQRPPFQVPQGGGGQFGRGRGNGFHGNHNGQYNTGNRNWGGPNQGRRY